MAPRDALRLIHVAPARATPMSSSSDKSQLTQPGERRASSRRMLLRNVKIVYDSRSSKMDCAIVNISRTGAKLRPADMPRCPDHFSFELHSGHYLDCEVIWRRQNVLGVKFVSSWGEVIELLEEGLGCTLA